MFERLTIVFGGANRAKKSLSLEVNVEGFDVSLATRRAEGEYEITVRSNGQNPHYPQEITAKRITFAKSPDQFNLATMPGYTRIAQKNNYSRIVLDIVAPDSPIREHCPGVELNYPKDELCVIAYIRDEKGREKLWSGMGIECLLPPRSVERAPAPAAA